MPPKPINTAMEQAAGGEMNLPDQSFLLAENNILFSRISYFLDHTLHYH